MLRKKLSSLVAVSVLVASGLVEAKERACSTTADATRTACKAEVEDSYWTTVGVCTNEGDDETRRQCLADAKSTRRDAKEECRDQFEAREDLCDLLGESPYDPQIDPASFLSPQATAASPNPYFPLVPGKTWIYEGPGETVTVKVTAETKVVQGVTTMVVQDDVVDDQGHLVETTKDFFAQHVDGTVWYFGEITQEIDENGLISTDGSFLAGVDGGKAGIVMKAAPQVGDVYRQEFSVGNAEDAAEVLATNGTETVPGASCSGTCVVTRDFTPLSPGDDEQKFYAPGVGLILEIGPDGDRTELISVTP